jgi:hypothetical protein
VPALVPDESPLQIIRTDAWPNNSYAAFLQNSFWYRRPLCDILDSPHEIPKPQINLGPSGFHVGPHRVRNPSTFPKTFTITAGAGIVPAPGAAERAQAKETVLSPPGIGPPRDLERRIVSAPQRGAVYQPGVKPRVWQFDNGGVLKERRIFLNDRPVANQP